MGGERASTVRMKLGGKICVICGNSLPPPHSAGEKRCAQCGGKHRVYMFFFERSGWYCQFLEEDCRTSLPKKLSFKHPEKILELAQRAGAVQNLEGRQAIEHAIRNGRGGIWLELSEDQYRKLKG
jgi:hypothetical protein